MNYWLNIKGQVVHSDECGESCNRDDCDEVRTVGFREAAEHLILRGFKLCERVEADERDRSG